ncbi:MAG TPA: hydrolase [Cyanobacteria bacterium UBA8530]|nr:hydrolase [Cyanobacteria bacterium UBA8530]
MIMSIALIFDMDGLLIDSEPLYQRTEKKILADYGITDFSILDEAFGMKNEEAFEMYVERLALPADPLELLDRCREQMLVLFKEELQLMPQAEACLETFHRKGYPMALASGSMRALLDTAVGRFGLEKYFSVTVSGDDVEHGKPDPEIFLLAAKKLGVKPSDCLVFEDAIHGVTAAKAAGMYCVAVPNPSVPRERFREADWIFDHLPAHPPDSLVPQEGEG